MKRRPRLQETGPGRRSCPGRGCRVRLAALAMGTVLAAFQARAECTPAAPAAVAEAERQAGDAERKADQAQSVAVRSGNPGAARRAEQARQEAVEARRHAAELSCRAVAAPEPPASRPAPGY